MGEKNANKRLLSFYLSSQFYMKYPEACILTLENVIFKIGNMQNQGIILKIEEENDFEYDLGVRYLTKHCFFV